MTEIFQEYAEDNDSGALLASLRVVARVRGISVISEQTGMTRRGLQKALSSNGNPHLENINSIINGAGISSYAAKNHASSGRVNHVTSYRL